VLTLIRKLFFTGKKLTVYVLMETAVWQEHLTGCRFFSQVWIQKMAVKTAVDAS
jgi:hypothetical protein